MKEIKIAEDFLKGITESVKFYQSELKTMAELSDKIYDQLYEVIELAEEKYELGQDYYGIDYLDQMLTWEEKKVLHEILDSNMYFETMNPALENLTKRLAEFIKELNNTIKEIN